MSVVQERSTREGGSGERAWIQQPTELAGTESRDPDQSTSYDVSGWFGRVERDNAIATMTKTDPTAESEA